MDKQPFSPQKLPLSTESLDYNLFLEELIDATVKLEVYKEKIKDSKLDSSWFMPTLQRKEALASSMLEGTQATLDGVLINQAVPDAKNVNFNEVINYFSATELGYRILNREKFSHDFICTLHETLLNGNVRKSPHKTGCYRTEQNYIGKNETHAITYIPPRPEEIQDLMTNLIDYINAPNDHLQPLIRTAIIHAQFETIHPFMDGNGRVGRMLIPMYLYAQKQIELPCLFISEALERDKLKYYSLLNNTRKDNNWNSWIKFFLATVSKQCTKYINIVSDINELYEKHTEIATEISKSNNIIKILNEIYRNPVFTIKMMTRATNIPISSLTRYLSMLVDCEILTTDNKDRNRTYICYDLLAVLRQ